MRTSTCTNCCSVGIGAGYKLFLNCSATNHLRDHRGDHSVVIMGVVMIEWPLYHRTPTIFLILNYFHACAIQTGGLEFLHV